MVQGKFFGSPHFVAPVFTKMCGHTLGVDVLVNCRIRRRAQRAGLGTAPVLLDQLAHLLHRAPAL